MGDVGNDDSGDAGDEEDYTAVADALDLDKGALDPIERATDNLNGGALGEVYLVGGEVDELLIVTVADGDELLHLTVGNDNGYTTTGLGTGEVLQIGDLGLQRLQLLALGIDEQQVVDRGDETTLLALPAADHLIPHGDEAAKRMGLKVLLGLQRSTKRGTHGIPGRGHGGEGGIMGYGVRGYGVMGLWGYGLEVMGLWVRGYGGMGLWG